MTLNLEPALITAHNKRTAYSGILEQTAGLVFMGTPHRGSDAAKWASMLKESLSIFGLGPTTNLLSDLKQQSRTLMQINSDFVERAYNIQQILSLPFMGIMTLTNCRSSTKNPLRCTYPTRRVLASMQITGRCVDFPMKKARNLMLYADLLWTWWKSFEPSQQRNVSTTFWACNIPQYSAKPND